MQKKKKKREIYFSIFKNIHRFKIITTIDMLIHLGCNLIILLNIIHIKLIPIIKKQLSARQNLLQSIQPNSIHSLHKLYPNL